MPDDELQRFLKVWDAEAQKTAALLRTVPAGQYDFRPDAGARSVGELAWHLAEVEAYISYGIEQGAVGPGSRPPGIERPKSVAALAPEYERVHAEAAARVRRLAPADLDRALSDFGGPPRPIRDILWLAMLLHQIHHRGQLSVLCRLAGGASPGMFGPNREETARRAAPAGA